MIQTLQKLRLPAWQYLHKAIKLQINYTPDLHGCVLEDKSTCKAEYALGIGQRPYELKQMVTPLKTLGEAKYILLAYLVFLIIFHLIYHRFFPTSLGTVGHDYSFTLPALLDGFIWFNKNGLMEVPWFTPSFCGGQPYFADPQSWYYSVPQWLAFFTDPLTAAYLTLLSFASVGFFGIYLLARRCFALSIAWALLAGALYFFNGFLPHRMIIGHVGYHGLTLTPWLALALLTPVKSRVSTIVFSILAGLIAAYWLQSGLTTLMVPAALSLGLILLVYRLRQPWPRYLFPRIFLAVFVSIALSASKLIASLSFYSHFERTQYLLPGFDDPLDLLLANLLALFGPGEMAAKAGELGLVNQQWALMPHEWAFGFTLVPLFVLFRARVLLRRHNEPSKNRQGVTPAPVHHSALDAPGSQSTTTATERPQHFHHQGNKLALGLMILAICLLPLAIQFYIPALNAWYKQHPLIGATVAPMRWLIIYLPVIPILTGLLGSRTLTHLGQEARASRLILSFILMIIVLNIVEPRRYYADQVYNPDLLLAAYDRLDVGTAKSHSIKALGTKVEGASDENLVDLTGNEIMLAGISQMRCYNPSFGYRLEKLPPADLIAGDVFLERHGKLNIRNPACFVFPEENRCEPGDPFLSNQRHEAKSFVFYHSYPFIKNHHQIIADWVTIGGLVFVLIIIVVVWPLSLLKERLINSYY